MSDMLKHNRIIAKRRSKQWRENLIAGHGRIMAKPSVINAYRVKKRFSQQYIARKLKVALSTYGALERGTRTVDKGLAIGVAKFFRKPVNIIFVGRKDRFLARRA